MTEIKHLNRLKQMADDAGHTAARYANCGNPEFDNAAQGWSDVAEGLRSVLADAERLQFLESFLSHPHYWQDLVLSWDHEDGVWLSTIRRGDYHGATPMEWTPKQPTLRDAIDAAIKAASTPK